MRKRALFVGASFFFAMSHVDMGGIGILSWNLLLGLFRFFPIFSPSSYNMEPLQHVGIGNLQFLGSTAL